MADPLFLSFLLLFFFCFFISMAAQPYPTCPSYGLCNNINISYPFWKIEDDQSQFCGYQDFGINCSTINGTEFPIIHFDRASYYVKDIIHNSKSIILVDDNASPIPLGNECPRVRHNINLQPLPFSFSPYNVNLSFHLNCTRIPDFATEIPCLELLFLGRRKSCVNVMSLEMDDSDWSSYECSEEVLKTVLNNSVPHDAGLGREYGGVLGRGFELKWHRLVESCGKCEESNGRCGYNSITEESMCFCSDGSRTTRDHCRTKKKENLLPLHEDGSVDQPLKSRSAESFWLRLFARENRGKKKTKSDERDGAGGSSRWLQVRTGRAAVDEEVCRLAGDVLVSTKRFVAYGLMFFR